MSHGVSEVVTVLALALAGGSRQIDTDAVTGDNAGGALSLRGLVGRLKARERGGRIVVIVGHGGVDFTLHRIAGEQRQRHASAPTGPHRIRSNVAMYTVRCGAAEARGGG